MKRPLAVLSAAAVLLSGAVVLAPTAALADVPAPTDSATPAPTDSATPAPTRPVLPAPPALVPGPVIPKTTVRWVNGTLTVVYSSAGPFLQGTSDWTSELRIDGVLVDAPEIGGFRDRVVSVHRAAAAGPAHVEVTTESDIERGSYYDVYPTTWFTATVRQHVVKAKKGQVAASALLGKLRVGAETRGASYSAKRFPQRVDANRDGETTRTEVLKTESTKRATVHRDTVRSGRWRSPYDGRVVRSPKKVVVDHLVPLQEAWTSGAAGWSTKKRTAFANDLGYGPALVAISPQAHRAKGSKEPTAYLPSAASYRCAYVKDWIAVKSRWGLSVDAKERTALTTDLATYCANPFVAKPGKPNLTALVGKPKPKAKPAAHHVVTKPHGTDPQYGTCTELKRHPNHAPYVRGVDPEYAWYQDRDHDGIVCE
ncbi:excalibur calcium-binding domain-containing protein [Amnibacterium setariae]|uniref:DUF1524 domain-containing protein n=1 Tax=Amnibacterium setariae TaxID=2306585 RepID=A0A3A1U5N3_9MICO|nr:excalibur calcium-binding domain-containing protein [Amnibacterium setariae]RIX28244.1 DUF1524 domain-containing protein [Amnibacterium setariae]